jgi:asparagine synthase (glutamine-hydrolysing)
MCGLCGFVHTDHNRPIDLELLVRMREVLTHRGPDSAGCYTDAGVGLGSRRLAILDLSDRGHMPMSTPDGRFWIVYNGEIYNYRDLRAPLEARGHHFVSNTDTEVLLNLFATEGSSMLHRLNGMFAFAVWDSHEHRLFMARDRLGIKPLYYAVHQETLYFASEPKALFAAGVPMEFDHDVWQELLGFRFLAGEQTVFRGVRCLLAGHHLIWERGQAKLTRWWNLAERTRTLRETPVRDPVGWYRETFDDAVNIRRISDVPVGVFLSGGLDSSTVAASLSRQASGGIASFTVGFVDARYDERPLARQVATRYRLEEHRIVVPPDRLLALLQQAAWFSDEPLAHTNDAHLLAISQHARPRVTVLLSGEGADETLGGYVRYMPLQYPRLLQLMRPVLSRLKRFGRPSPRLEKLGRFLELGSLRDFVLYNACDVLPEDLAQLGLSCTTTPPYRDHVLTEGESLYPDDLMRQAMYSDQHTFLCSILNRTDRMTMGASIECRLPFLDYRLVEGVAALPTSVLASRRVNKTLLRQSLGDRLPKDILRHRKWGFGVPWKDYVRSVPEVRRVVEALPRHDLLLASPIDLRRLNQQIQFLWAGDDRMLPLILQLVMVTEAWCAHRAGIPAPLVTPGFRDGIAEAH